MKNKMSWSCNTFCKLVKRGGDEELWWMKLLKKVTKNEDQKKTVEKAKEILKLVENIEYMRRKWEQLQEISNKRVKEEKGKEEVFIDKEGRINLYLIFLILMVNEEVYRRSFAKWYVFEIPYHANSLVGQFISPKFGQSTL